MKVGTKVRLMSALGGGEVGEVVGILARPWQATKGPDHLLVKWPSLHEPVPEYDVLLDVVDDDRAEVAW